MNEQEALTRAREALEELIQVDEKEVEEAASRGVRKQWL